MKNIFTILLFFIAFKTFSQGNLQFNQVVIVNDQVQTVPAGKVWKVESYQQQQVSISTSFPTTGCSDLARPRPYLIDNIQYHNIEGIGHGNTSFASTAKNNFPFWLKAGQTLKTSCPGDILSVLEFNIVP